MQSLTPVQAKTLAYIARYEHAHGYAPTYREIQTTFGLASVSAVHRTVQNLIRRGVLLRANAKGGHRAYCLAHRIHVPTAEALLRAIIGHVETAGVIWRDDPIFTEARAFLDNPRGSA